MSRQKVGLVSCMLLFISLCLPVVYVVVYQPMCLVCLCECIWFGCLVVGVFSKSEDYNLCFVTYKTTTVLQIVEQAHLFI